MNQKVLTFRTITEDEDIEECEVLKFLKWGKGDVGKSLNYYYNRLEQGKIKRKNNQPSLKNSFVESLSNDKQKQQQVLLGEREQESNKKLMGALEVSSDQGQNSQDVFSILRRGSMKHKKTHDFIEKCKEIYKLPIKGKSQKELLKSSKSIFQKEGANPQELALVNCLPEAFSSSKIGEIHRRLGNQNRQSANSQSQMQVRIEEESQQFYDIGEYEYKHVYTNKQCQKKVTSITNIPNPSHSICQIQKFKNSRPSPILSPVQLPVQFPVQPIKKPPISNRPSPGKKPTIKSEQIKEKPQKRPMSQKIIQQSPDNPPVDLNYPFCEKLEEEEIYMGEYFLKSFGTQKMKLDTLSVGCPVEIVPFIEEMKTKKKNFGKKQERKMDMQIYHRGRNFGRIADEEVRIIMPLIDEQMIRMEFYMHDFPLLSDIFKSITLKAKVFLTHKLITEPIVQNFEPKDDDKDRVHQISGLLQKLNLPIFVQPLVKGKSKYIQDRQKKQKKESIDHFNYRADEDKKKQQLDRKTADELTRWKTDPTFKTIQKSLKDMIKSNMTQMSERKGEGNQEHECKMSEVQKKVIEIDTKAEKDKFTELIELHDENLEPYYPHNNFKSHLYHYQALALAWMLKKQGYPENDQTQQQIHPLWTEYGNPHCEKYRIFFNELTGQVCVRRPKSKVQCKGGILADEMGLGKTVMMASLIVSHVPLPSKQPTQGNTLVIMPLTLLSQWETQLATHTQNQKVLIYYSTDRKKYHNTLHQYNVVLSTYGTISHQFAQGCHIKKTGIYRYKWHRIILDEAHYIKGRVIQTSKAVYQLSGLHRWCLTGTPIQNTVGDLFSLLHFIKYTPWSEFACWSRFIAKPLDDGEEGIYQILRTILKRVFLRRTKNSQGSDGKPIIQLPPRISKIELLTMSSKQRQFYDSIYTASKSDFDALVERGILQAKYMQVLEMLMRLRQICCHPILFKSVTKFTKNTQEFEVELKKLITRSQSKNTSQQEDEYYEPLIDADLQESKIKAGNGMLEISEQYFQEVLKKIATDDLDCCIICFNKPEDPVINCCLHIFCKSCNVRQIESKGFCSCCRRKITKDDFIYLPRENRLNSKMQDIFPSTKMIALKQHLLSMDKTDKVVIFSQFLGMLDLLANELTKYSFKFVRMEGCNSHKERTKIVSSFQNDPSIQIFLVSLKTAGVGLNLVAANKVFLMDPWWNPAVQEQAIERVHRIGQKKSVEIIRFIMDETIETRMLELNTSKKQLSQNVLNNSNEESSSKQKVEKLKYLMENY